MDGGAKKLWIIANWKSNKTIVEALEWVGLVGPKLPRRDNLKVVVCPTFSTISEVVKAVKVGNFPIIVGAQDLSPFEVGAYTGEESAELIKDLIGAVILGHSERRHNFSETDEMVAHKSKRAIEANITPIVCVQGNETPVPDNCKVIAYEPESAISTGLSNTPGVGKADDPFDADKVAKFFKEQWGEDLEVIYGGSVNSENVKVFTDLENINGVLVGNASLDAEEFLKIVKSLE